MTPVNNNSNIINLLLCFMILTSLFRRLLSVMDRCDLSLRSDTGYWILDPLWTVVICRCAPILDTGYWMLDAGCSILHTPYSLLLTPYYFTPYSLLLTPYCLLPGTAGPAA